MSGCSRDTLRRGAVKRADSAPPKGELSHEKNQMGNVFVARLSSVRLLASQQVVDAKGAAPSMQSAKGMHCSRFQQLLKKRSYLQWMPCLRTNSGLLRLMANSKRAHVWSDGETRFRH